MMRHLGDITKLDGAAVEPVWCVTGGSPCQDLSVAGKRAGLAGARSGLFMEQIRVVKEMREHDKQFGWAGELIRPRYMVWENVPGALSSNKGRDFAAVLEETIRIVEPEAPGIEVPAKGWPTWGGYRDVDGRWSVAWRVHDAQYWGVPQRRRRISLVADFGGDTAHEILFERTGVPGNSEPRGAAWEGTTGDAEAGANYAVRIRGGCDGGGKGALVQTEINGTLGTGNDQTIFCYGISAYESNAMKSSNPKSGVYVADTSRTLDLNGGNPACNQGGIAIVQQIFDMTHACDVIRECGAVTPSLQARMGTGGNQVPLTYQMQGFGDYRQADVASACSISASKVARLDTIKAKLIPQIKQYYDDGRMPESVAYEIAKCSADDQQLIAKVKGNGQDGLGAMRCGETERILSDRDSLAARKCKYACGVPCGNVIKSLQKTTGNYMRSCEHTCCMECYDIATCDKYCKVAKDRHLQLREDKAEAEQRANDEAAKRRGERESKCHIYWGRLTHALAAYGEQEAVAEALHTTVAGLASSSTYYAPYRSVAVESLDALVAVADILGVSTDYLLGRTDDPRFTTPPQRESKKEDDA